MERVRRGKVMRMIALAFSMRFEVGAEGVPAINLIS